MSQLVSEFDELREKTKQHLVSLLTMAKGIQEGLEVEKEMLNGWLSVLCKGFETALEQHQEDSLPVILPGDAHHSLDGRTWFDAGM